MKTKLTGITAILTAALLVGGFNPIDANAEPFLKIKEPKFYKGFYNQNMNVCAGEENLKNARVLVTTDRSSQVLKAKNLILAGKCQTLGVQIKANDPNTINSELITKENRDKQIAELKGEISELKQKINDAPKSFTKKTSNNAASKETTKIMKNEIGQFNKLVVKLYNAQSALKVLESP